MTDESMLIKISKSDGQQDGCVALIDVWEVATTEHCVMINLHFPAVWHGFEYYTLVISNKEWLPNDVVGVEMYIKEEIENALNTKMDGVLDLSNVVRDVHKQWLTGSITYISIITSNQHTRTIVHLAYSDETKKMIKCSK